MNRATFYIFEIALYPRITIMVRKKILKNKDIQNASKAFIFESMSNILIFFVKFGFKLCRNFGLHISKWKDEIIYATNEDFNF